MVKKNKYNQRPDKLVSGRASRRHFLASSSMALTGAALGAEAIDTGRRVRFHHQQSQFVEE